MSQANLTTNINPTLTAVKQSRSLSKVDIALLIIRLGLGASIFLFHGWPKLWAGPSEWLGLGKSMEAFGIRNFPRSWGFAAALTEVLGGALVMAGVLFRPACGFVGITMFVAFVSLWRQGADFIKVSLRPLELFIVWLALLLAGPGRCRLRWRTLTSLVPDFKIGQVRE